MKKNQFKNQSDLDNAFIIACENEDLNKIKQLINDYPLKKQNHFHSFLRIFGIKPNKPTINLHCQDNEAFIQLAIKGNAGILKLLNQQPNCLFSQFTNSIERDKQSSNLLDRILHEKNLQSSSVCPTLINLIYEHVNEEGKNIYHLFVDACSQGKLDLVKFISLNPPLSYWTAINNKYSEFHIQNAGFISACENGHLEIVKFLTTSQELKNKVDFRFVGDTNLKVPYFINEEILSFFIFDLELPEDHQLFDTLIPESQDIFINLFQIKKTQKKLAHTLPNQKTKIKQSVKI